MAATGNLQAALDSSRAGDRILLAPGGVYTGQFYLRRKTGTAPILLQTDVALPARGTRMTPATAATLRLATIRSSASGPGLRTEPGASNYWIAGVTITAAPTVMQAFALVRFGDLPQSATDMPRNLVLDRVVVAGRPDLDLRRCVELHSGASAVVDSYLDECHARGADSQGIYGTNGSGPYRIENNYVEGAGMGLMFGGDDATIVGQVPSDITVRRNHFFKPLAWRGVWSVKNALELKIGKRVLFEGNVIENVWPDGQIGTALLFKSVNQGGRAPWSETSDVTVVHNLITNVSGVFNLAARPEFHPAVPMARVTIAHNVVTRVGAQSDFGGTGRFVSVSETNGVQVFRNTAVGASRFVLFLSDQKQDRIELIDNLLDGAITSDRNQPAWVPALNYHATQWVVRGNVIGTDRAGERPAHNLFLSQARVVAQPTADGLLAPLSGYGAVGADLATLRSLIAGVR